MAEVAVAAVPVDLRALVQQVARRIVDDVFGGWHFGQAIERVIGVAFLPFTAVAVISRRCLSKEPCCYMICACFRSGGL